MERRDIDFAGDIRAAFGLLTRLPVRGVAGDASRGAASAWAWPIVGAIVGAAVALAGSVGLMLGLPVAWVAAVCLAVSSLMTGALHEDGLADTADGLFGGWTVERRLEIMKDSHVGSYGVLALLLVTLARWSALTALLAAGGHWGALIAVGAVSRAPMAVLMAALPQARRGGLSAAVGRPSQGVAVAAVGVAVLLGLIFGGFAVLGMVVLAGVACAGLGWAAKARIGGQTGDILGASQQLAEVAALGVAAGMI
ncbi:MAG: adenosylcobinamide-GDP ribazoletransferase [Pseudomonadota bacterium]